MMKVDLENMIEMIIVSHCEGATDRLADGVLFKEASKKIADAIRKMQSPLSKGGKEDELPGLKLFPKQSESFNDYLGRMISPSPVPPTSLPEGKTDPEILEAVKDWCKEMGEAQNPSLGVSAEEMKKDILKRLIPNYGSAGFQYWNVKLFTDFSDNVSEKFLEAMDQYTSSLLTQRENTISMFEKLSANQRKMIDSRDETIRELREALEKAIGTIEMECDDLGYLNELKNVLSRGK